MLNFDTLHKLKAMIHYIVENAPHRSLGKVKLNKILWFADKNVFLKSGKTIPQSRMMPKHGGCAAKGKIVTHLLISTCSSISSPSLCPFVLGQPCSFQTSPHHQGDKETALK